jgi:hypothetical protein
MRLPFYSILYLLQREKDRKEGKERKERKEKKERKKKARMDCENGTNHKNIIITFCHPLNIGATFNLCS